MFQKNLKALRKQKGITQEELAARLNVVRQTVSKWEKGLSVPDSELLICCFMSAARNAGFFISGLFSETKLCFELGCPVGGDVRQEVRIYIGGC